MEELEGEGQQEVVAGRVSIVLFLTNPSTVSVKSVTYPRHININILMALRLCVTVSLLMSWYNINVVIFGKDVNS